MFRRNNIIIKIKFIIIAMRKKQNDNNKKKKNRKYFSFFSGLSLVAHALTPHGVFFCVVRTFSISYSGFYSKSHREQKLQSADAIKYMISYFKSLCKKLSYSFEENIIHKIFMYCTHINQAGCVCVAYTYTLSVCVKLAHSI